MAYPVFVYGTLKRGQINHVLLEGVGVKNIQKAWLEGAWLYDIADPLRPYPYPAILPGAGKLLGELVFLQNPTDGLLVLDHLECEGFEYRRLLCWVRSAGRRERAWVYIYASRVLLWQMKGKRRTDIEWQPRRHRLAISSQAM